MKRVLIVEDDQYLSDFYKELLEQNRFKVFVAAQGKEALKIIRSSQRPDLILLDLGLPGGMSGFDILKQIKEDDFLKQIPVIVFSNYDAEQQTALGLGADDYIVKADLQVEDLVGKVRDILDI